MNPGGVDKLRLLCRLRQVERDGARARLALTGRELDEHAAAERAARAELEASQAAARDFLAEQIAAMAPTRDGASAYKALALAALYKRREAAGAGLQHRRALSQMTKAEAAVQAAGEVHAACRARSEAVEELKDGAERAMARQVARRADEIPAPLRRSRGGTG
jgi:hypothetical protein